MYLNRILAFILLIISFTKCTSVDEAVRKQEKFSLEKKYALLSFECTDTETGRRITEELRNTLRDFGFNIIDQSEFNKLLAQNGLNETEITKNYTKAIGKLKGVDALIIGEITQERIGTSSGSLIASSSAGGSSQYVKLCASRVIDLGNGEILTSAIYISEVRSNISSTTSPAQVANKLARKLSPH